MSQPCNQCSLPSGVPAICGDFNNTTPTPDLGRCFPYRVKRDCGAPDLPVIECNDDTYVVVAQPGNVLYPFIVISTLFDELCDIILDSAGNPILTTDS